MIDFVGKALRAKQLLSDFMLLDSLISNSYSLLGLKNFGGPAGILYVKYQPGHRRDEITRLLCCRCPTGEVAEGGTVD